MPARNAVPAHALAKAHDQLAERDEVRKIVRQQLMEHLEGGTFWESIVSALKPVASVARTVTGFIPHPAAQAVSAGLKMLGAGQKNEHATRRRRHSDDHTPAAKPKRKLTDRMKKRNELVRKLMREEGMTLPEASAYIKQHSIV